VEQNILHCETATNLRSVQEALWWINFPFFHSIQFNCFNTSGSVHVYG